jgi:hypothetical protein
MRRLKRRDEMLQRNSFFSSPLIFYGSHLDSEEDEEDLQDDDEENLSESWIVAVNSQIHNIQQNKIGLFIHWIDPTNE